MKRTTQLKLESLIRKLIREESPYWKQKSKKKKGDTVQISGDQGGGTGVIIGFTQKDGDRIAIVKMDDGTKQQFNADYLDSL